MPIQARLPKFGFRSRKALYTAEVRLSELKKLQGDEISLSSLREAGLISASAKRVRIIKSGEIERGFKVDEEAVALTKGARAAIEAASSGKSATKKKAASA